jgi:two-component system copper resistance phosphate regulon response regulator CusR
MAKILLVEDEINIASFIERGLKEFGHTVTVCHDGNAGWKILQDEPFDLLILDIIMPKINGLELCRLYRQPADELPGRHPEEGRRSVRR